MSRKRKRSRIITPDTLEELVEDEETVTVFLGEIERASYQRIKIPKDQFQKLILPYLAEMYEVLRKEVDDMINEKKLTLEDQQKRHIGFILLTILFSVSIILSTLSYFLFNMPEMGILFLYGAIASIGGIIFVKA